MWAGQSTADVKKDRSELGGKSFDRYKKVNPIYLTIFLRETRIPNALLCICFTA